MADPGGQSQPYQFQHQEASASRQQQSNDHMLGGLDPFDGGMFVTASEYESLLDLGLEFDSPIPTPPIGGYYFLDDDHNPSTAAAGGGGFDGTTSIASPSVLLAAATPSGLFPMDPPPPRHHDGDQHQSRHNNEPEGDEEDQEEDDGRRQRSQGSSKKHAPLGQWITPPQPQYAGSLKKNYSDMDVHSTAMQHLQQQQQQQQQQQKIVPSPLSSSYPDPQQQRAQGASFIQLQQRQHLLASSAAAPPWYVARHGQGGGDGRPAIAPAPTSSSSSSSSSSSFRTPMEISPAPNIPTSSTQRPASSASTSNAAATTPPFPIFPPSSLAAMGRSISFHGLSAAEMANLGLSSSNIHVPISLLLPYHHQQLAAGGGTSSSATGGSHQQPTNEAATTSTAFVPVQALAGYPPPSGVPILPMFQVNALRGSGTNQPPASQQQPQKQASNRKSGAGRKRSMGLAPSSSSTTSGTGKASEVNEEREENASSSGQVKASADALLVQKRQLSCPDLAAMTLSSASNIQASSSSTSHGGGGRRGGVATPFFQFPPALVQAQGMIPTIMTGDQFQKIRAMISCPNAGQAETTSSGGIAEGTMTKMEGGGSGGGDAAATAEDAEEEERRRQKLKCSRAAASARLRRLRDKNLTEMYEQEVMKMDLNMKKLRSHVWGIGGGRKEAQNALGRERVLSILPAERVNDLKEAFLGHCARHVQSLRDEAFCLESLRLALVGGEDHHHHQARIPETESEQLQEFIRHLKVTPQQNAELQTLLGRGSDYETVQRQLDGLEGSLEALRSQVYKPFPNLQALINIVQASFEKEQFNRFLEWTDSNRKAIQLLDLPPSSSSYAAARSAATSTIREGTEQQKDASSAPSADRFFHFFGSEKKGCTSTDFNTFD